MDLAVFEEQIWKTRYFQIFSHPIPFSMSLSLTMGLRWKFHSPTNSRQLGAVETLPRYSHFKNLNFRFTKTIIYFQVQSSCLFNLLLSLETPSPDPLNIAELVKEEKPLKAIDFCYHDENEMVTVLDCISLCVMVVSYSAESVRGYQMLVRLFFLQS